MFYPTWNIFPLFPSLANLIEISSTSDIVPIFYILPWRPRKKYQSNPIIQSHARTSARKPRQIPESILAKERGRRRRRMSSPGFPFSHFHHPLFANNIKSISTLFPTGRSRGGWRSGPTSQAGNQNIHLGFLPIFGQFFFLPTTPSQNQSLEPAVPNLEGWGRMIYVAQTIPILGRWKRSNGTKRKNPSKRNNPRQKKTRGSLARRDNPAVPRFWKWNCSPFIFACVLLVWKMYVRAKWRWWMAACMRVGGGHIFYSFLILVLGCYLGLLVLSSLRKCNFERTFCFPDSFLNLLI